MGTFYSPVRGRGSQFYRDIDGMWTDTKRYDEVLSFDWDITDALETGEAISSVSYDASGLTVNSDSYSGNVVTIEIEGTGNIEVTVVLDSGREIQEKFRWLSENQPPTDYSS